MFHCPNDQTPLVRHEQRGGVFWSCDACGGRTATIAMLRRAAQRDVAELLWSLARASKAESQRHCPACERPMKVVSLPTGTGSLELDVCTSCYFVWFDPAELESLPAAAAAAPPRTSADAALPLEARLALARYEVEALDPRPEFELPPSDPPPEGWKAIPAFFGLPVKQESRSLARLPLATWTLAGCVALLSGLAFLNLQEAVADFGLIPSELWRYGGLTLLTAFFLHGSLPQLAGNLYFILTFGDDVEDYLGQTRFLWVLLLSSVAGSVLHALLHPHSPVPLIGASGGISGMLVCYGLQFPMARIGFLIRLPSLFFMRWVNLRAWAYVLVWILLQTIGVFQQGEGITQVSPLAHLGGAVTGFLFWFFLPESRVPDSGGNPAH